MQGAPSDAKAERAALLYPHLNELLERQSKAKTPTGTILLGTAGAVGTAMGAVAMTKDSTRLFGASMEVLRLA